MAGVPHEWSSIPAARQIENIKGDVEPACAVGYYRSPDRESYSLFTDVMFLGKPHVAIASSKNDRVIKRQTVDSLLSDRSLTLLAKKSYSYGDVLDNKISVFAPRMVLITTDSVSMARMIAAQRADYMFCAEEECAAILKTPQLQGLELTLVRLSDMPQPPPRYFMCSRKVGAETISRVSEALRKIIAR
jgi:polar amino acid transport system substrate-binding protein